MQKGEIVNRYGIGTINIDLATGIRYGVINQYEVLQAWADTSTPYYGKPENFYCDHCGNDFPINQSYSDKVIDWGDDIECPSCGKLSFAEFDDCGTDALSYYVDDGEYMAEAGEDGDIFITASPYFTRCLYCSPCAPGAGWLMSPDNLGIKAYCFGHDWFEEGIAPYPVFLVKNGRRVYPDKQPERG